MDYFRSKRYLDTLPDWEIGKVPSGNLEDYLPRMRCLLNRLENPEKSFTSIIVGGTNGKGTVSSLLAAFLRTAGKRVGLYTSPHLHTIRERIQIDGEVVDKDRWSGGVTELYERTRRFESEALGAISKFEALTGLAAYLFAEEEVEFGVFEVGLGGRYDATNAWDSSLAVLTRIQLDHIAVLGNTLTEIVSEKFPIARPGRPLLTLSGQAEEVDRYLLEASREKGVDLRVVGDTDFEGRKLTLPDPADSRPTAFFENGRLALAAAIHLMGPDLTDEGISQSVVSYFWPGRFEVARKSPWTVLDGAHNPSGAAALVGDLGRRAEEWTFLVGVNSGHDAKGILKSIQPLARKVILTQSVHPKAMTVDALKECLPEGLIALAEPEILVAMGLVDQRENLCVMGSLHLVAQAREALSLPLERDGFSEDVLQESLVCLEMACGNLGIACQRISDNGNVLRLHRDGRPVYFMRNKHPFNDYVSGRLAEDKAYQNEFFSEAGLRLPPTLEIFNPLADARFERYKTHASISDVLADVEERMTYPVVVKRNRSSLSQGVFLEPDRESLDTRVRNLCENSGYFDNILLVQAFVSGPEYRIVASGAELLLAYEKVSDPVDGKGDLNPLHQADGQAIRVEDARLLRGMRAVVEGVASVLDLGFYAIDVILADSGFYILEVNPNPICYFYNSNNGREDFVSIYEQLLQKFLAEARPGHVRLELGGKE
jgi:dihydrofolate synthase/folylpolyglutamate synthase